MSDNRDKENEEKFKEDYGCRIKNYISDAYSICREERQYALFLYNILRYYRKPGRWNEQAENIFTACQIPKDAEVTQVFYEATFMRDFFERNRRIVLGKYHADKLLNETFSPSDYKIKISEPDKKDSFNYKLLKYVLGDSSSLNSIKSIEEKNLGRNKLETDLPDIEKPRMAQWMMNVTPDIAVLYKKDKETYLLFLECKFESDEASYSDSDVKESCSDVKKQCKIQWKIADFLCNYYFNREVKLSDCMKKNERSCLVRFARSEKTKKKKNRGIRTIFISDLIDLNDRIFL